MLYVDVTLLQDADAVARTNHVLRRVQLQLYYHGTVDLLLRARRRVLSANFARLVKHVWGDFTDVRTDENLKHKNVVIN